VSSAKQRRGAFSVAWKDVERWDTFFYRYDFFALEKQFLRIKHIPLGAVVRFISRNWKRSDFPDEFFEYIEISSVTKNDGIVGSKRVDISNAPSRATTLLKAGDIILSTTRPYLGAFAVVPEQYGGYVCSSGFALADGITHDELDKDFLMYFLKTAAGLRQMERRMTGGLYPAITQDELGRIKIPLPPKSLQKKIMERVAEGRAEIAREQEAAERLSKEISAEVEALIIGSKSLREQ
jgi:restriction endonuclease S subunit